MCHKCTALIDGFDYLKSQHRAQRRDVRVWRQLAMEHWVLHDARWHQALIFPLEIHHYH